MPITLNEALVEEMANVGVIYGHKKSKTHPRMKPFIGGNKNEIELIDPEATITGLEKAIAFMKEKLTQGGMVLFVGTSASARGAVETFAKEYKFPYVTNRWLGGTLTNFKVINDRRLYYEDLKTKKEKGLLAKYTKKEQLDFSELIGKLSKNFDGLATLIRLPDILFVVDIKEHETSVREARKIKIPIVAIIDTDDDLTQVDYPIFANDHAKSSIEWIIGKIKEGLKN